MKEYLITERQGEGEITEKKSRFIAHVIPVNTEAEAVHHIEQIRKKYWDARHNCFAYVIGRNNEIQRFSDDGEPQGTAGKPILEVLMGSDIHDTLIVVTRYFGGVLLGTGGLVRAYGLSAKEGLKHTHLVKVCEGVRFRLQTDYNNIGKIKYIMAQMSVTAVEEYGADVILTIEMRAQESEQFCSKVTDATSGKAVFGPMERIDYKEKI